jgi:hypothetical protein
MVESINTTIKAVLRRARVMRGDEMLLLKLKWLPALHSVRSRLAALCDASTDVLRSVKTAKKPRG